MNTDQTTPTELARRLQWLMTREGTNATKLSPDVSVPQPTIQRILRGKHQNPTYTVVRNLANHFNVTVSELWGDDPLPGYADEPEDRARIREAAKKIAEMDDKTRATVIENIDLYYEKYLRESGAGMQRGKLKTAGPT